ncbi:MAG: cysteine desulfurase [Flavobacteriales bacterium]|nr:cysteine desulfurase [Crocinitomicaceae bacterium]NBX79897.1 cysteine desulfurase [Flavobacteriales bacterium]NCA20211.1 cysteine desulfurase [Crocinitomicaceae bacterium]
MRVYLDNAATTPVAPEVVEAMLPILKDNFGNPSSTHFFGRNAKALIETSRRSIAAHLKCQTSEIIFTSGGTEADNMAIYTSIHELGVKRIITTTIEHHAVGHTVEGLLKDGLIELTYVKIDAKGHVDLADLERLLQENKPTLVSLMHANNEIATLLPLKKVVNLCHQYNAYFHSDTVQTMGHYLFDLTDLGVDFITCAAHKFHGPKGIGFLYINKKNKVGAFIHGGAQERGLRGGTENIYGIVGLAKAMDLAYEDVEGHQKHVQSLKTYMMEQLNEAFDDIYFHGETDPERSLYTVLNVCFPKTAKAGMLLFTLDLKGVAVSGGSACSSGAAKGSHVLEGILADMNRPNVRFSFSRYTTKEEIDFALKQVVSVFEKNLV